MRQLAVDRPLILASASPRRRELLQGLCVPFHIHPSSCDETIPNGAMPHEAVEALALLKARAVAEHYDSGLVIGSDTIVVCDGEILGKPVDEQDAWRMLSLLQGRSHEVYTGIAVVDSETGAHRASYSRTVVYMRPLPDAMIERYIRTGEPNDKAGSYAIQGIGAMLIERIDGDYFTVVGLPLNRLADLLAEFGVQLL